MATNKKLIAYHGNPTEKRRIMRQLRRHKLADEIVQGRYWEYGKGCAVGCTMHDPTGGHNKYPRKFGIPEQLAHLEDKIFESLPNGVAKEWPIRFMGAIKSGADLAMVWPRFALWLLREELPKTTSFEATLKAIDGVAVLYERWLNGKKPKSSEWEDARNAASAAWATSANAASAYAAAAFWQRASDKLIELIKQAPVRQS